MTAPEPPQPPEPVVPDTYALRRRVLLAALMSVLAFVAVTVVCFALDLNDLFVLVGAVIVYLLVTRPLMKPVNEAIRLRRDLAYGSWLAAKGDDPDSHQS